MRAECGNGCGAQEAVESQLVAAWTGGFAAVTGAQRHLVSAGDKALGDAQVRQVIGIGHAYAVAPQAVTADHSPAEFVELRLHPRACRPVCKEATKDYLELRRPEEARHATHALCRLDA